MKSLLKLENSVARNLTIDPDINAICAYPECACAQIIDVLATFDSEV